MVNLNKMFEMETGTEEIELDDYHRYYLSDMVEGQEFSGEASVEFFPVVKKEDPETGKEVIKKYSQIRVRLIDEYEHPIMDDMGNPEVGEYLDIYLNCPLFKENGLCSRVQKPTDRFDFHRNLWNFLTGIIDIIDPSALIDPLTEEEINIFKKINLKKVAQFIEKKRVTIKQVEVENSNYPTFKIIKIE